MADDTEEDDDDQIEWSDDYDFDLVKRLNTEEARIERHPPDGKYEGISCTCSLRCKDICKGECGCRACGAAYGDSID